jgi:hypothetical protein
VSNVPAHFLWPTDGVSWGDPAKSCTDLVTRNGTWSLATDDAKDPKDRTWHVEFAIDGDKTPVKVEVLIWGPDPPFLLGILDCDRDPDEGHYLNFSRTSSTDASALAKPR